MTRQGVNRTPASNLVAKHSKQKGGFHADKRRRSRMVRNSKHKKSPIKGLYSFLGMARR